MTFINHYEILEIEANADLSAIKSAFNKLAMRYHPDRNLGDPIAEAMMKKLNQALRTLSDSKLRKSTMKPYLKTNPTLRQNLIEQRQPAITQNRCKQKICTKRLLHLQKP